jgi:hypothetical protein
MRREAICLLCVLVALLASCAPQPAVDFAIYLPAEDMNVSEMASVDLQSLPLQDAPLIATDDIVTYTWGTHEIKLTAAGFERVMALQVRTWGLPFVVCVDRKPVYWGAFWTPYSSQSFEGVTIMLPLGADNNTIRIELGYPSPGFFQGTDPRVNTDVRKALEQAGKLR